MTWNSILDFVTELEKIKKERPFLWGGIMKELHTETAVNDLLPVMCTPITHAGFSGNALSCLAKAECVYLGDIAVLKQVDLLRLPRVEPVTIHEIRAVLKKHDLHFGMDATHWKQTKELNHAK